MNDIEITALQYAYIKFDVPWDDLVCREEDLRSIMAMYLENAPGCSWPTFISRGFYYRKRGWEKGGLPRIRKDPPFPSKLIGVSYPEFLKICEEQNKTLFDKG